ncbi:MAG: TrkA family potassium uptake protein [Actinomycetota bacterium]
MNVVIMGCGRVGSELTIELSAHGHTISIVDKSAGAFDRLPPGFNAKTVVGMGFDRDVLEEAGIKEADAFLAVSSGDNSNIVSARVAREHYKVPNVIARINDPERADIYERLNIPTIAPVRWGVKQIMLMLFHEREEIRESLAGGSLLRVRVNVPEHLIGKPVSSLEEESRVMVVGVERGGSGFIPAADSTYQKGDVAQLVLHKDALDGLDALLTFVEEA